MQVERPDEAREREDRALIEALQQESDESFTLWEAAKAREAVLVEALRFYADPETYFAIALMGDPPHGPFLNDLSDEADPGFPKPGKRARKALAVVEAEPAAVTVTPAAEAFVRREGKILTVDADENGLRLDTTDAGAVRMSDQRAQELTPEEQKAMERSYDGRPAHAPDYAAHCESFKAGLAARPVQVERPDEGEQLAAARPLEQCDIDWGMGV